MLVDIFGRIEGFFVRLEIYTGVPLTPEMTEKMVQITVEILGILAVATNEIGQSRASEFDFRSRLLEIDIVLEKFLKKVAGRTDLEDGLRKLEKLINEEIAIASARLLNVTDKIDNNVTRVGEGVRGVDGKVQAVKDEIQLVNGNVKAVEDKVRAVAEGGQNLFRKSLPPSQTFIV